MKPSFAIAGCGKVGTALGKHLSRAGYRLTGISCRSLESAKQSADIIGTWDIPISTKPWEITKDADITFITTPDGIIADVCEQIAKNKGLKKNAVVLHCSGAHPSTILASAKQCQANIGSMHPLQSFASLKESGNSFEGIIVSVEGAQKAVEAAEKIAKDLNSVCIKIKTETKTFYHASAVVASNYFVTVQDFACKLIKAAGISDEDTFKVLGPLVKGTLANIEKVGPVKALTGPIARGDAETVKRHTDELRLKEPDLLSLYNTLGLYTIKVAQKGGTLSDGAAKELEKILKF